MLRKRVKNHDVQPRQHCEEYVSVDPSMIDSVMEMAIDKLLKREATRMGDMHLRINDQIAAFEAKYKMSSEEFRSRYDKGSVGDDMDFIEWAVTLDMREKIQRLNGSLLTLTAS